MFMNHLLKHLYLHRESECTDVYRGPSECELVSPLLCYRMTLVRSEGHPRLGGHWGMGT